MKRGFTMVELIFVIVIIGILATIAIPKLSGTRDDAKVVVVVASAKQVLTNLAGEYTAQGTLSAASIAEAEKSTPCVVIASSSSNSVTAKFDATNDSCNLSTSSQGVLKNRLYEVGITSNESGASKEHKFGGSAIKF